MSLGQEWGTEYSTLLDYIHEENQECMKVKEITINYLPDKKGFP